MGLEGLVDAEVAGGGGGDEAEDEKGQFHELAM